LLSRVGDLLVEALVFGVHSYSTHPQEADVQPPDVVGSPNVYGHPFLLLWVEEGRIHQGAVIMPTILLRSPPSRWRSAEKSA
jgi:hypothetical protein